MSGFSIEPDALDDGELAATIDRLVAESVRRRHRGSLPGDHPDRPQGKDVGNIPYAGRVFGPEEVVAANRALLDFWLTLGPEGERFERSLARELGVRRSILTNSGSSANLLAITALTSHMIEGRRRLRPGDEVITCAAGFPTTVAPIIQAGLVPVLLDADPTTGNMRTDLLEEALTKRTGAVMLAHALGNPFDISRILAFCREHDLWLIEDNCDALGSRYTMEASLASQLEMQPIGPQSEVGVTRPTGSWGDLSTQSFYPPHHITLGEGGAVNIVRNIALRRPIESIRDWGRDCWCPSGEDDTCGKRFSWQLGELPEGYDHKYTYSHLGYNLKPLDIQAAIGNVQLERLEAFSAARRVNWQKLRAGLEDRSDVFEFALPMHSSEWKPIGDGHGEFIWGNSGARSDPSWFGFMLLVREDAPFSAVDLSRYLDENAVGNRRLFGGNLVRQPAFIQLRVDNPDAYRTVGDLRGADALMSRAVFIGTFAGLTDSMLERMIEVIQNAAIVMRSVEQGL